MTAKYSIPDIVKDNFITGYRAYDVCRNNDKVYGIRSINNSKYDINISNINKNPILYNEETTSFNQKIPYIYGTIHSYIDFESLLENKKEYTLCALTKYNGANRHYILNVINKTDNLTAFGHINDWAGIVYYNNNSNDKIYKSTNDNGMDQWIATCVSYDENSTTTTITGYNLKDSYKIYNHKSVKNINGNLNINNYTNPVNNSDWAFSTLLLWDKALSADKLSFIYESLILYKDFPIENDIVLYNNYPRELTPNNCAKQIETFDDQISLNISKSLWAGYYAGDYNSNLNILPNLTGDISRDLTSNMLINVKYSNTSNIPFLSGSKKDGKIIFPDNSINSNFTICSITKYTSTNPEYNNMILREKSITNPLTLFYHGHYNNKNGVIEYNSFEFSKGYISTAPINSWTVTCAKNAPSKMPTENVIINGINTGLIIPESYIKSEKKPQTLAINYNNDSKFNELYNSDWALSYLLIWDSHLSDEELKKVSNALNDFLKTGKKLFFNINNNSITLSPISNINTNLNINTSLLNSLDLTPIQKQILRL